MTGFKTELHCHTKESSICSKMAAQDVVKAYIDAGYSTLVITDHYGMRHIGRYGEVDEAEHFLRGYRAAQKAAEGKINIILGMEISLAQHRKNDYLVYGDVEHVLMKNPELYKLNLTDFCDYAHANGLMVYQAHPFRNDITIIQPHLTDGIEVFNSHPRHDSRNDIAAAWAEKFQIRGVSGSDAHQPQDVARSGIVSETEIKDADTLLQILREGRYRLRTL